MPLTDTQLSSLQPVIQGSAALSFVGAVAIITTYIFVDSFRRPSNRLVFFMSFADLFASLAMFLAEWPVTTLKNKTLCTVQGWSITFFLLAAMFWTACLSLQILLAIRKGSKLENLVTLEKWFHLVCWGVPFVLASIMLVIGEDVYTDATLWCWIGSKYQGYRLWFFYLWLWAIFFWNLGVYFFVGFVLMKSQKQVAKFASKDPSSASTTGNQWAPSRAMRIYIRKTSFFILAFFLNWLWGSINRIQNMVDSNNPVYVLFLLHAIFTPLQGFLNFIAYFLIHYLFRTNGQPNTTATISSSDFSKPEVRTITAVAIHNFNKNTNTEVGQDSFLESANTTSGAAAAANNNVGNLYPASQGNGGYSSLYLQQPFVNPMLNNEETKYASADNWNPQSSSSFGGSTLINQSNLNSVNSSQQLQNQLYQMQQLQQSYRLGAPASPSAAYFSNNEASPLSGLNTTNSNQPSMMGRGYLGSPAATSASPNLQQQSPSQQFVWSAQQSRWVLGTNEDGQQEQNAYNYQYAQYGSGPTQAAGYQRSNTSPGTPGFGSRTDVQPGGF